MDHRAEAPVAAHHDGILQVIRDQLADQIRTPFEIRLWGDRTYRFGKGEPEVKVFVNAGAALEADIAIRYHVGAASWVPFYDARLATGTKAQAPKLQLVRRASIQQRSGESWNALPPRAGFAPWTDDHSSVLPLITFSAM